jgi:hypothetical protein
MKRDCRAPLVKHRLPGQLFVSFLLLSAAGAQNIILKTGQTIETKGVRRFGDMVMAEVLIGSHRGEVGYRGSTIERIEFIEPPELKATEAFLAQGEPEKALIAIAPVVTYYEPLRDIPGNWWAQAALLKVSALSGMKLDKEAESLGTEIRRNTIDPEAARAVRLQVIPALLRQEEFENALQLCNDVIKQSTKTQVLAEAWVHKGEVFLARRQWVDALCAYLRVPVFYEQEKLWMPPALLGSARAYRGLDDVQGVRKSLDELVNEFPKSPQAEVARIELKKLPHEKEP